MYFTPSIIKKCECIMVYGRGFMRFFIANDTPIRLTYSTITNEFSEKTFTTFSVNLIDGVLNVTATNDEYVLTNMLNTLCMKEDRPARIKVYTYDKFLEYFGHWLEF